MDTWQAAVGNGVLGEARVRALLLERFDVLTRSVDIDGADFLIQLRDSGRFSDLVAPRLGIIQAKFAESPATGHDLPVDYAVVEGVPIKEFFVIVTEGREDDIKYFLLSAADVFDLPIKKNAKGKEFYSLTSAVRNKYEAAGKTALLDRIQNDLVARTAEQNDKLLNTVRVPNFEFLRRSIESKWLYPIANEHGYIPDLIYQLRTKFRSHIFAFDDFLANTSKLLTAEDAEVCLQAAELVFQDTLIQDIGGNLSMIRTLDSEAAIVDDLRAAISTHKRRFDALVNRNQKDRFLGAYEKIYNSHQLFMEKHLAPIFERLENGTYQVSKALAQTTFTFDLNTNDPISVVTELVAPGCEVAAEPNQIVRARELWRHNITDGDAATWRELHRLQIEVLAEYIQLLLSDENVKEFKLPFYLIE
ncbi:hypothetical protein [Sinorhizobium sp. CCBAU 05631]|uniref:hypothetical protein n=1 Tax=Sinorhizobium sp. CCBAU 05631 TaxID=794846 RepID=UPI0012FA32A1|nr:hypothetical protein [Sinorhizobium sp. CCBAU 05631]